MSEALAADQDGMADLRRRVDENIAALYAGEVLPHTFSEEESLALRPRHNGFGVQPDGRIAHCGNAVMDLSWLEVDLWNDELRRRMERDRAFQMRLGRLYAIYEYRGLILVLTVAAVWWFASR